MPRHITSGRHNSEDRIKGSRYLTTKRHQVHVLNEKSGRDLKRHPCDTKKLMAISANHNLPKNSNGQIIGEIYACRKHPNGMVSTLYLNELDKRYGFY